MSEETQVINRYLQIQKQYRSNLHRKKNEGREYIKKSDIYHNQKSNYDYNNTNNLNEGKTQFTLDLSKIKPNNITNANNNNNNNSVNPQKGQQILLEQNSLQMSYEQELDFQYQLAVHDQIQSERNQKQKQLYIPNLNQYLEDFKKRKYKSPSVSSKVLPKNPYQNIQIPQEYIEKLAGDMMDSFREGKTCAKYENVMGFIKGKPFYIKLGEMNYRQSEKNKVDLQEQPSSLQYQHIRAKKQQLGERPLSREKKRENERQNLSLLNSNRNMHVQEQNDITSLRPQSIQTRRDSLHSRIYKRDFNLNKPILFLDKEGNATIDNIPQSNSKIENSIQKRQSISQKQDRNKFNNFFSRQATPNQKQDSNQYQNKLNKDLSLLKNTFDAGVSKDSLNNQSSTKQSNKKSILNKNFKSHNISPRDQNDNSYDIFLTQDLVSQNFVNANQKINNNKREKEIVILLQNNNNEEKQNNNKKQSLQASPLNSYIDQDTIRSSSARNKFSFEKQTLEKMNQKLDQQLKEKSTDYVKRLSVTERMRPGSEMKIIEDNSLKIGYSQLSSRMQFLSTNKPRSAAGNKKIRNNEDSLESLACGSILNDCKDILRGSSIEEIGQADYFNERYFQKNINQNEKKHKIKKDIVNIWQSNRQKEKEKQKKENLLSEIEEQVAIVKQFKEEQPMIKTELQKSGAIIDRYFRSQNVVKPFFQKKIQSKSIV